MSLQKKMTPEIVIPIHSHLEMIVDDYPIFLDHFPN